jgi:dTDP-4-amino-4,6-dideoxygalactose transaminase
LPVTEDVAGRAITLPLYATLALEQVDEVCGSIAAFMSRVPVAP